MQIFPRTLQILEVLEIWPKISEICTRELSEMVCRESNGIFFHNWIGTIFFELNWRVNWRESIFLKHSVIARFTCSLFKYDQKLNINSYHSLRNSRGTYQFNSLWFCFRFLLISILTLIFFVFMLKFLQP